jgi:hypothetical protein
VGVDGGHRVGALRVRRVRSPGRDRSQHGQYAKGRRAGAHVSILTEVAPGLSRADGQHKDHEEHKDHEDGFYDVFVNCVICVIFVHRRDSVCVPA